MFRPSSIFLVEDDPDVRATMAAMLRELGHRVVAEAATIPDASAFAVTAEFDLAVLDINIGGYRIDPVVHLVQRRFRPMLFVTGNGTRWLPSLFRGHAVLEKPISIEKLEEMIDGIVGHAE
ncbi:response regulator [Bradyrhizobium sp. Tv2a-2]|uniref:response regulator n=1 Tax=Bradyrhizobium sp. Tv2a-2 TaxID=113395 RepID=UPI00056D4D83|nr:response regulator [Bradyrhizobium sp. Tv2a-2]